MGPCRRRGDVIFMISGGRGCAWLGEEALRPVRSVVLSGDGGGMRDCCLIGGANPCDRDAARLPRHATSTVQNRGAKPRTRRTHLAKRFQHVA